jgi:hypothetical protein
MHSRTRILVVAMILSRPVASPSAQDHSALDSCRYDPDAAPAQAGPGRHADADYSFSYVSDYEEGVQLYRRKICNHSQRNVRFDWSAVALKGKCTPNGVLSEETPAGGEPRSGQAPLQYDYRQLSSQAYLYESPKHEFWPHQVKLTSTLSGYVQLGDELTRVHLRVSSALEGKSFLYSFENDSAIPVKISWQEFSRYWRERSRLEYQSNVQRLSQSEVITPSGDLPGFVLNAKAAATWQFTSAGTSGVRSSSFDVFAVKGEQPDLSGVVPLYLPVE